MKIYVLIDQTWDGGVVKGVTADREKAEAFKREVFERTKWYSFIPQIDIVECEMENLPLNGYYASKEEFKKAYKFIMDGNPYPND